MQPLVGRLFSCAVQPIPKNRSSQPKDHLFVGMANRRVVIGATRWKYGWPSPFRRGPSLRPSVVSQFLAEAHMACHPTHATVVPSRGTPHPLDRRSSTFPSTGRADSRQQRW